MKKLLWVFFAATAVAFAQREVRFNHDIRPILSDKCFLCHGPDKNRRMANMRLDRREVALERGAIVPGDTEKSKLVQRIFQKNKALRMPPVYSNKELSEKEKQTLRRWIEQGGEYEPHWAYLKPERQPDQDIDSLVARKLREAGLEPVGEADRRTLIRRLSFDLTGLPPTPEEVERFVADRDPAAYEKLADRLLASPAYGERIAVWWLDLVRYADTVGYHSDVPISVWPYRDYVIRSFNENKPFDQFTREQLAGDLMPNATRWQKVASAYNRLARMTNEGGAQAKEYLAKYAADRVRTTATVWLGSTMGCSECHDHKFDPFLTREFYLMEAFFADIEEKGVYSGRDWWGPSVRVPDADQEAELERIGKELERLRKAGAGHAPSIDEYAAYRQADAARWYEPKVKRIAAKSKIRFRRRKDGSWLANGKEPGDDLHVVDLRPERGRLTAILLEALPHPENKEKKRKWEEDGFLLSRVRVDLVRKGRAVPKALGVTLADYEEPHYPVRAVLDQEAHTGWGALAKEGRPQRARAIFVLARPVDARRGDTIRLSLQYKGRRSHRVLGHFRLLLTGSEFPEFPPGSNLNVDFARQTGGNGNWLAMRRLERERKAILDHADECLVSRAVEPRPIRVLPRGNWMDKGGELVEPGTPRFLNALNVTGRRPTRLDLADWIVSRDNPLTARVVVNRLWKMFFGTGISKRLDDLGSQGEPPVNQELLDSLAVEFMDSGWDIKHMVRLMVLSKTYRRSSEPTEELLAKDPYDRLHGRQSPARLEAEFVRDTALAVSGLLNRRIGGPSAHPYQPAGYYKELNFPKRVYHPDRNENQFRRGLYTHWQRSFLHPSLLVFDAPTREECNAERAVSNTPLQALTLLNDPTYVEAARAFAARILEAGGSDAGKLRFAFQEALSRDPREKETEILMKFLAEERSRLEKNPKAAGQLLSVGIWKTPPDLERTELAAWTSVVRALLNKQEFIMRY